jgi:hypothetical protein
MMTTATVSAAVHYATVAAPHLVLINPLDIR